MRGTGKLQLQPGRLAPMMAPLVLALSGAVAHAQGEMTTTDVVEDENGCPAPSGRARFDIKIEADPSIVQAGGSYLGLYVQEVAAHWEICTDCPAATLVYLPFWEIWVPAIIQQQCQPYNYSYTEWVFVGLPPAGSTATIKDYFTVYGDQEGREATMEATSKKFIGSDAEGFGQLFFELDDANEAPFWRGRVNGEPFRAHVMPSASLPPHYPNFPEYGNVPGIFTHGAQAAVGTPQALVDVLSNPNNAGKIIDGGTHEAQLLWICCPGTKHHVFDTSADNP